MAREHLKAFRDIAGVKLTGIYSRTRAKAESVAGDMGVERVCDSIDQLADHAAGGLLIIAVPELAARAVCLEAFKHDWTVLAEKPLGYNLADAEAIHRVAQQSRRRVFVGLNRRFLSSTRTVLDDLATREGPRVIAVFDNQSQTLAHDIGHPPEVVENWMYANSIHLVDYLCSIGRSRIQKVHVATAFDRGRSPVVVATVDFESGDRGLYHAIWNGPGPWMVHVTTPTRRWEMRPLEQASFQNAGERTLNPSEQHVWDKSFKPGFRLQAEHAVRAHRGQPNEMPTIDDALITMRLISQIYATG